MDKNRNLSDSELSPYLEKLSLNNIKPDNNQRVNALILQQSDPEHGYPRLVDNLKVYSECKSIDVSVNGVPLILFLNPTRTQSLTSSTFDNDSNKRGSEYCFLCNLDEGQRGILIRNNKYLVLTNPGITIPGDLTIASVKHTKQLITGNFHDMLDIARELYDFSIFFNGALAGASSAHFHFQAGYKDKLIGEKQLEKLISGEKVGNAHAVRVVSHNGFELFRTDKYLRSVHIVSTNDPEKLCDFFDLYSAKLYEISKDIKGYKHVPDFGRYIDSLNDTESEGRLNIMLKYNPESDTYLVAFFPKRTNRPECYYKSGNDQIILGMAIKEALGNIITCRKRDFDTLVKRPDLIQKSFAGTSLTDEMYNTLNRELKNF